MVQSEKERVKYYVEKRQLSFRVDGLQNEKTSIDRQSWDFQHDYDGALAKEEMESDSLKKVHDPVEEFCHHGNLFCNKVPTYNDRFETELHEGFSAFFITWERIRKSC